MQTLDISLRKMTLQIEELLLLKLLQFFGYVQQDDDIVGANQEEDECLYATQRFPSICVEFYSLKPLSYYTCFCFTNVTVIFESRID